jgi:trehalose 6-phosphate synthase/phosphatase
MTMRKRIITVSNRLPIQLGKRKGTLSIQPSIGGLATGLSSLHKLYDLKWLGWPGYISSDAGEQREIASRLDEMNMVPLFLGPAEIEGYYEGFSNKTIWPLFHYFTQFVNYDSSFWETYREVNQRTADAVLALVRPDDLIWIHDYHLMLVPGMIRAKAREATVGFFLHIPFPSFELFRTLPWREELIEGMLGADLVGFHTYDYARHFTNASLRLADVEQSLTQLVYKDRIVRVDSFPMGIDFEKFSMARNLRPVIREVAELKSRLEGRKVVLSIDRLDYSKGILQRLIGFRRFLGLYPQFHEKLKLLMVVVPTRSGVDTYKELRNKVNEWVGRINGEFSTIGWTPVTHFYRSYGFETLAAMYQLADICLVTPFRDGMNLVAKEYIACRGDEGGVLILSEMAGAAEELREALPINPNDVDDIAKVLYTALTMPEQKQREGMQKMRARLRHYDVKRWSDDFINSLSQAHAASELIRAKEMTPDVRREIIHAFRKSQHPVIFLDYDGTLRPFEDLPEQAFPDSDLLDLLAGMARRRDCRPVLISGRDRLTLQQWFGHLPVHLVAEHGAWIKNGESAWYTLEELDDSWKEDIRVILNQFVERTPGSMVEEKSYSLVWHYRKADLGLAEVRTRELLSRLGTVAGPLNLQVLQGSKVIEVKNTGIHKGRAALHLLEAFPHDFILALGDDWTDEYLFKSMSMETYTIKVGIRATAARYCISTVAEARDFLKELARPDR